MKKMVKIFVSHLIEFLEDFLSIFPENKEVQQLKNFIIGFSKINPKAIVMAWKCYITDKYKETMSKNDEDIINFICTKDYGSDLEDVSEYGKELVHNFIDKMKTPIAALNENNKKKTVQYLKNLMTLSELV